MERHRDLRDYALVFGFPHAPEFVDYLVTNLDYGDLLLDMGCGAGRGIVSASRVLFHEGVECHALDRSLPDESRRHRYVQYHEADFAETGFASESVREVLSVCGLGMYAEEKDELREHLSELERILRPDGTAHIVVDPVIYEQDPIRKRLRQEKVNEFRVQSPERAREYFICNLPQMLSEAGLQIARRTLPYGSRGMMIDDEVALEIVKKSHNPSFFGTFRPE